MSQISGPAGSVLPEVVPLSDLVDVTTVTPTKGDLLAGDGTNFDDLPVGVDGQKLAADSAEGLGLKWVTPEAHAASVIVKADGTGDATTIAAGIALLPTDGGVVFLHAETFSPSTLVLPSKPIEFIGSGRDATIINVPAGAALFSSGNNGNYALRNMNIVGDASAGQIMWDQTVSLGSANRLSVSDVELTGVEKIFKSASNFTAFVSYCRFSTSLLAAARLLDSALNENDLHLYRTIVQQSAGLSGPKVNLRARDCELAVTNNMNLDTFSDLVHCVLEGTGNINISGKGSFTACSFDPNVVAVVKSDDVSFSECKFTAVVARQIDVESGFNKGSIIGCKFSGATSEAVRLTDADEWTIGPNINCKVLEAGTSDKNRFRDITTDSTVIGPFSEINGSIIRTADTDPVVGDDINDGILVGTHWVNKGGGKAYICRDNTAGAAVWELISDSARIKKGAYTGDGTTSQSIVIETGFSPKYVKIWLRDTVDNNSIYIAETTPEIMDDNAAGGAAQHLANSAGHRFRTNQIISLDSDGFTVDDNGVDANPNSSGVVYNYMAIS